MARKIKRKWSLASKRFFIIILGLICAMIAPLYCGTETSNVLVCVGTLVFSYMGVRAVNAITGRGE